jgi:hypothetical protein
MIIFISKGKPGPPRLELSTSPGVAVPSVALSVLAETPVSTAVEITSAAETLADVDVATS